MKLRLCKVDHEYDGSEAEAGRWLWWGSLPGTYQMAPFLSGDLGGFYQCSMCHD